MAVTPSPRRVFLALAAVAGVVVAHVVDYLLLFPSGMHRSGHLEATGHGYWPVAVGAALATGAVTAMLVAARAVVRGCSLDVRWRELVVWQAGAFLLMEVAERAAAAAPVEALPTAPELWLGLLLQAPVAWLVARVLGTLERVASTLRASSRRNWAGGTRSVIRPPRRSARPLGMPWRRIHSRAPPLPRFV